MAHKKAAGSAKNLRDSNPKYRGVKVYGGQSISKGGIIIRQKGDKYKLGKNTYKAKDYTIHAAIDGVVHFGKKKYVRFDGRSYLRTFVEVVGAEEATTSTKKVVKKAATKKVVTKTASTKTVTATPSDDLTSLTLKDLKAKAKALGLKGYSTLKKDALIEMISAA